MMPFSDQFNTGSIDPNWIFVNPLGDASVTATGSVGRITLPSGTAHDQFGATQNSAKLVQPVSGDWDIVARWIAKPTGQINGWGFYADGGATTNWLRADIYRSSGNTIAWSSTNSGNTTTQRLNTNANDFFSGSDMYLRLAKAGTTYTYYTSSDGILFTQRVQFVWAESITRLGIHALNAGGAPPATNADCDWFMNISDASIPPVANAGPDQAVEGGDIVTLDGTGSSDANGTIAGYSWAQLTGTPAVLSSTTIAQPSFSAPYNTETLTFGLTVTDNSDQVSSQDVVAINVQNLTGTMQVWSGSQWQTRPVRAWDGSQWI